MKNMKKCVFEAVCVALVAVALVGCGGKDKQVATSDEDTQIMDTALVVFQPTGDPVLDATAMADYIKNNVDKPNRIMVARQALTVHYSNQTELKIALDNQMKTLYLKDPALVEAEVAVQAALLEPTGNVETDITIYRSALENVMKVTDITPAMAHQLLAPFEAVYGSGNNVNYNIWEDEVHQLHSQFPALASGVHPAPTANADSVASDSVK